MVNVLFAPRNWVGYRIRYERNPSCRESIAFGINMFDVCSARGLYMSAQQQHTEPMGGTRRMAAKYANATCYMPSACCVHTQSGRIFSRIAHTRNARLCTVCHCTQMCGISYMYKICAYSYACACVCVCAPLRLVYLHRIRRTRARESTRQSAE